MSVPLPQPRAADSALKALDSVPLFMRSLPSDGGAGEAGGGEDVALEALHSLVYEGTPDEIAQNFKDQGNEYFRGRRFKEAVGFYTQGLDASPSDPAIREALLLNRAACNLELQNYGRVLRDTKLVLEGNPGAAKALFRAGAALTKLGKWSEALDALGRCVEAGGDAAAVKGVREEAQRGLEKDERRERERREKKDMRKRVEDALSARAIYVVRTGAPPPHDAFPTFDPAYLEGLPTPPPPTTPLVIPVLLLYPLHAQSDLLPSFPESATFASQLSEVLATPPPWDGEGKYVEGKVSVYVVTRKGRVFKVGMGRKLLDVWPAALGKAEEGDGVILRDGWLEVYVLPRGEDERKWVEERKRLSGR